VIPGIKWVLIACSKGAYKKTARLSGRQLIVNTRCSMLIQFTGNRMEVQPPSCLVVDALGVDICVFGVLLDELPSWRHLIAHEHGENAVGFNSVFDGSLAQNAA
jgi:hypothetical protein